MTGLRLMVLGALVAGLPAAAHAQTAEAELQDAQGNVVGTATLVEAPGGVRIALRLRGLRPGDHGVHIHAVGKCEPPAFTSAGGHYNPRNKKHGRQNPEGPHAGDLGNLTVNASGAGAMVATATDVALTDAVGLALVVHADPDDEKTDPMENAGARVVCGVIAK
jgi:superoxide dismutase, Cu-Zn family